jgi:hypothetical protein
VTRRAESPPDEIAVAGSGGPDRLQDATTLQEFLQLEPSRQVNPANHRFSPLLSWLVAHARPDVTVELGPAECTSLFSTCDAVRGIGAGVRCLAVRLPASDVAASSAAHVFHHMLAECTDRYGDIVTGYDSEGESLAALEGGPPVDLLHVSLFDLHDMDLPDLAAWFDVMAPGGIVVVTSTAANVSSNFAKARQLVSDRYPSVCISLGLTTEALVAQVPVDGAVPTVEVLRNVPSAVGGLLDIFSESVEALEQPGGESVSPVALRAIVARLIERQDADREALLSALRAYKDLTTRLTIDVSEARSELASQAESARLEREHLVKEFLDRLDVLSAKISTSAARFAAQLEEKDRLLEEQEQRVLAYAGRAVTAQSVIDDIRRSSSWRITAPLRLVSRIAGRRTPPAPRDSK